MLPSNSLSSIKSSASAFLFTLDKYPASKLKFSSGTSPCARCSSKSFKDKIFLPGPLPGVGIDFSCSVTPTASTR